MSSANHIINGVGGSSEYSRNYRQDLADSSDYNQFRSIDAIDAIYAATGTNGFIPNVIASVATIALNTIYDIFATGDRYRFFGTNY